MNEDYPQMISSEQPCVAVIVPVYNESQKIYHFLKVLMEMSFFEVIVVDGGSSDNTLNIIKKNFPTVRCYQTDTPQRSTQMNLGASKSKADVFVFVHADVTLPEKAVDLIQAKITQGYTFGGFFKRYDKANVVLSGYVGFLNYIYFGCLKGLVGTNVMFVKRDVFEQLRGFPNEPFLEDVIFADQLRKMGLMAVISKPVLVSSRKYYKRGFLKQILINFRIMIGYRIFHESPKQLFRIYRDH